MKPPPQQVHDGVMRAIPASPLALWAGVSDPGEIPAPAPFMDSSPDLLADTLSLDDCLEDLDGWPPAS
jgi:hypothetical protein